MLERKWTRREWMAAASTLAGAAATAGCTRRAPAQPAKVSIVRAPDYDQTIYSTVRQLLEEHRLDVRGRSVVLKPNLVEFEAGSCINTHPMLVHAALEAFRSMGASSVQIAEGPGHRRITLDLCDAAGYFQIIPKFDDLFVDLNLDDVSRVEPAWKLRGLEKLYLPKTALGADLFVSMAKMKTHHWAVATLSMKNLFGVVPGGVYGWPKNVLHWAGINESIALLHQTVPRQFALVDGIVGMEGNGPIQGVPKRVGVLVAGSDPLAVDATCCRIMQIDPSQIAYLTMAAENRGVSFAEGSVLQIGEKIADVATRFQLAPGFESLHKS